MYSGVQVTSRCPAWPSMFMFLILILCFGLSHATVCNEPASWTKADECCSRRLPLITTQADLVNTTKMADERNITSFWVSLRKKQLPNWQGIDGAWTVTPANGTNNGYCAMYDPETGAINASSCNNRKVGQVCEIQGSANTAVIFTPSTPMAHPSTWHERYNGHLMATLTAQLVPVNRLAANDQRNAELSACAQGSPVSCPQYRECNDQYKTIPTAILQNNTNTCYVYDCKDLTWHQVRGYCQTWRKGWRLAVFGDVYPKESPVDLYCKTYWVGLRRLDWLPGDGGVSLAANLTSAEFVYSLWANNEPAETGDCAYMKKSATGWRLHAESCQKRVSYFCIPAPDDSGNQKNGNNVAVIVGTVVPLAIILLLVMAFIIYKKWNKLQQMFPSCHFNNEETIRRETYSLVPQNQKLQDELMESLRSRCSRVYTWSWGPDKQHMEIDHIFIDLEWTRRDKCSDDTAKVTGKYTDMFKLANLVFIEGPAGTGKSTLAQMMAMKWCFCQSGQAGLSEEENHFFKEFSIVLLITLRDVRDNKDQTLQDVIQQQYSSIPEDKRNMMYNKIESNPKKTLIILEGYDEYSESKCKDITDIAHKKMFPESTLLITSRHPPSHHIPDILGTSSQPVNHILLRGFSEGGVGQYVEKFCGMLGESGRVGLIKEKLNNSTHLRNLSYAPAILLLMCTLWKDDNTFNGSDTTTGFLKEFVFYACGRYEYTYVPVLNRVPARQVEKKYEKHLMKIGDVSLYGLERNKLQHRIPSDSLGFSKEDIAWKLGFLREETDAEGEKYMVFHHQIIQEFFLAFFIVHSKQEKRIELLRKCCQSSSAVTELEMVHKFLGGIGKQEVKQEIIEILKEYRMNIETLLPKLQLVYLEDDLTTPMELPPKLKLHISDKYSAEVYSAYMSNDYNKVKEFTVTDVTKDCSVTEYIVLPSLSKYRQLTHLKLTEHSLSPGGLQVLIDVMSHQAQFKEFQIKLCVSSVEVYIDESTQREMTNSLPVTLQEVSVRDCLLQDETDSVSDTQSEHQDLLKLYVSMVVGNVGNAARHQLKSTLPVTLQSLTVSHNNILQPKIKEQLKLDVSMVVWDVDENPWVQLLQNSLPETLQNLKVRETEIPQSEHQGLAKLELFIRTVDDAEWSQLKDLLPITLQNLSVRHCRTERSGHLGLAKLDLSGAVGNVGGAPWPKLMASLPVTLENLDVSNNNITDESVKQLTECLPQLHRLHTVRMYSCNLQDATIMLELFKAIDPPLKTVSVAGNKLGDGLAQITDLAENLKSLESLDLMGNGLSEDTKARIRVKFPKDPNQRECFVDYKDTPWTRI